MKSLAPLEAASRRLGTYTDPIPPKLLTALEQGRLIAFIGAGVSMRSLARNREPLPGWGRFLGELVAWASNNNLFEPSVVEDMVTLVNKGDYLLLAQECKERLGDEVLGRFIYEVFDPDGITPTRLHELIAISPFAGYITTNYDNLLERSFGHVYNKQMPVATLESLNKVIKTKPELKTLVKLHGDIEDPASIVLAHRDYLRMIWDRKKSRPLKELLSEYSFLFIGCSLTDLDILLPLDELAYSGVKCNHFLLAKRGSRSKIERNRLRLDRQVEVIEYYDAFNFHNHIDTFLEGLIYAGSAEASLKRIRISLWRRISIHQTEQAEEDGKFIWHYLFREGAITHSQNAQDKQWEVLQEKITSGFRATDYLIIVTTKSDLEKEKYHSDIEHACAAAASAGVHIVFLVVGENERPNALKGEKSVFPTFLLKNKFSEVDLVPLRTYLEHDARSGFKQP